MAYAKITLIGAMNYYANRPDDLFDFLQLPEGLDKEILIDDLVYRAGDFELLHIDPYYTRYAIGAFSNKWQRTWQKWKDALDIEYNPLHNYDRTEEGEDLHTGTQNIADTGTQGIANTGTQTLANTGTQSVANTGTQTINNTGTQTNKSTGTQTTDIDNTKTYNSQDHTTLLQTVTESGTKTTATTNTVAAFNEPSWSNKDKSDTLETPNLATDTTSTSTLTHNGYDDDNTDTTLTNDLTDTRTDNLSQQRTDALNELRTDNLNQQRTDALNQMRTDNLAHNRTDNLKDSHTLRAYGNIGVTTSQQMLQSELDIQRWNIYEQIADMFISEFCLMIY